MNGIDWTDVILLMVGLEGIHECRVELTVTAGGQAHNGMLSTTALAWIPTVEPQHTKEIAKVVKEWPDRTHPTYDSFVFNLLYDLDRAIGQVYRQDQF